MAFIFKLEDEDGEPADPLTFKGLRLRLEGRRPDLPELIDLPIRRRIELATSRTYGTRDVD
jgi:hypothetical protein